ncbi:EAL domain-containing protein [Chelativorans salis]|uniref:EAL domain-containing protein n=1 Tax=Chelativorans salis TaxID=2978478 RepID=A0ABT2LNA7_9HYPH|nr:EAL domain-containing protein [Chelativorans sp. EGI FJ00035]MCT7374883.1 EAL domain-containing protein [Chelativorans sp. EGI FJ00035]
MADVDSLSARIDQAILVDEVGIETGRYGPYFLKTLYQPVFHNSGKDLMPIGLEGLAGPHKDGELVAAREFFREVTAADDTFFIENLCQTLHLHNYPNIGVDGLTLFVKLYSSADFGLKKAIGQVEHVVRFLEEISVDPALLVCEIAETTDDGLMTELAAELRRHGIRIAVDDFGIGRSTLSRVRLLNPEVVKVDGGWFRRIAEVIMAAKLLRSLVDALQREGREVLIQGIETPSQLRVALGTGTDFLQGYLLGRPRLAGAIFDTKPLNTERLLAPGDGVISLFADRNGAR